MGYFFRIATLVLTPVGLAAYPLLGAFTCLTYFVLSTKKRVWCWWIPLSGLLLSAILGTVFSNARAVALLGTISVLALMSVLVLLYARLTKRDLLWVGLGLGLAGLVMGSRAGEQIYLLGERQAVGFTFHPNMGASLALITAFGILGSLGFSKHWGYLFLLLSGLVAVLFALLLSGSRSGYLGFTAGLTAWFLLIILRVRLGWIFISVLSIGIGSYLWLGEILVFEAQNELDYLEPLRPRLESLANLEGTTGGRIFMTMLGLQLASYRPFLGYGFGAWQRLLPEVEPSFPVDVLPHSHNLYVELLLDGGSLLLVAVLMFFAVLGWALLRRAWAGSWAAAASFAALVGFSVSNLFDVLAYQPYVTGLFLIVLVQGLVAGEGAA